MQCNIEISRNCSKHVGVHIGALLNPAEPTPEAANTIKDSATGTIFKDSATGEAITDSGKEE